MNKQKNTKNIYSVIIMILCLLFVILLLAFTHAWKEESDSWDIQTDTLYSYLENGDYPRLYQLCCLNRATDAKVDADIQELYAVADYYHNAFYYYGLQDTECTDLSVYQENMKQSKVLAGDLSYAIEDIDELLQSAD